EPSDPSRICSPPPYGWDHANDRPSQHGCRPCRQASRACRPHRARPARATRPHRAEPREHGWIGRKTILPAPRASRSRRYEISRKGRRRPIENNLTAMRAALKAKGISRLALAERPRDAIRESRDPFGPCPERRSRDAAAWVAAIEGFRAARAESEI